MHMHYWELSSEETFFNQEEDYLTVVRLILKKNSLLKDNTDEEKLCITEASHSAVLTLFKLFKNLRSQWIILSL